jgi:ATP dependent DNA ligase domain
VRLFTRNGHDWTDRYPPIVEAALRNRATSFVIDGEAVLLGVDGISDFDGLHSRQHDDEVQIYAFDCLALEGDDCASCRSRCARPISPASWRAGQIGSSWPRSSRARSDRICSARLANRARGSGIEASRSCLPRRSIAELGKSEKSGASRDKPGQERFRRLNPKHERFRIGARSDLE